MRTVLLALALLMAAPTAALADDTIATLGNSTPISAYGGRLLWSVRDSTGVYRLVSRAPDGTVDKLPIAARKVPFDADLGPGPDGATWAVYSRCAKDPAYSSGYPPPALYDTGRACDVYAFDFGTRDEHKIAGASINEATEFWPSIWRDQVAFGRVYDKKPGYPYIYVRRIGAGEHSRRMPGGQRKACQRNRDTGRVSCTDDRRSRPVALDLYGRRLAFMWTFAGFGEGRDTEIRMDTVGGGHRVVRHLDGGGSLTGVELDWPSFEAGRLYFAQSCWGDPGGCPGRYGLFSYRYSTSELTRADGPALTMSQARDGGRTYVLEDTGFGACLSDPGNSPTCRLVALDPAYG